MDNATPLSSLLSTGKNTVFFNNDASIYHNKRRDLKHIFSQRM